MSESCWPGGRSYFIARKRSFDYLQCCGEGTASWLERARIQVQQAKSCLFSRSDLGFPLWIPLRAWWDHGVPRAVGTNLLSFLAVHWEPGCATAKQPCGDRDGHAAHQGECGQAAPSPSSSHCLAFSSMCTCSFLLHKSCPPVYS